MSEPEGIPDFIPLEDDPTGLSSLFATYGQATPAQEPAAVPLNLPKPVPMSGPKPVPAAPTQDFSFKADTIDAAALGHWNAKKEGALNDLARVMREASMDDAGMITDTYEMGMMPAGAGGVGVGIGSVAGTPIKVDRTLRSARRASKLAEIKQTLAEAEAGIAANTRPGVDGKGPNMVNKIFQGAEPMAQALAPQVAAWGAGLFGAAPSGGASLLIPVAAAGTSGLIMGKHAYDATAAQALIQYGAEKGIDITTPQGMQIAMSDPDFVAYRDRLALKVGSISTVTGTALGLAPGAAQVLTKGVAGKALAQTALSPATKGLASSAAGQTAGLGTAVSLGTAQQVANNYVSGRPIGEGVAENAALFGVQDLLFRTLHAAGGKGYDYYKSRMAGTNVGAPGAGPQGQAGAGPEAGPQAPGGGSSGRASALNQWQLEALIAVGMPANLEPHQQVAWIKANRELTAKAFADLAARSDARGSSEAQPKPAEPKPAEPSVAAAFEPEANPATAATEAPDFIPLEGPKTGEEPGSTIALSARDEGAPRTSVPRSALKPTRPDFELVDVDPKLINDEHERTSPGESLRTPGNELSRNGVTRTQRAKEFIQAGNYTDAEPAELAISDSGKLFFTNGRHRLKAEEELGSRSTTVSVPRDQAPEIARRFGAKQDMVESARDDGENTPIPGGYREAFFAAKKGAGAPEPKQVKWWTDVGHDTSGDTSKQFLWAIDAKGDLKITSIADLHDKLGGIPFDSEDSNGQGPTHLDWEELESNAGGSMWNRSFNLLKGPAHGRIDASGDVVRISMVQKNHGDPAMKADMQSYVKGKLSGIMGVEPDQARGYDFTDATPFKGPEVFSARDEDQQGYSPQELRQADRNVKPSSVTNYDVTADVTNSKGKRETKVVAVQADSMAEAKRKAVASIEKDGLVINKIGDVKQVSKFPMVGLQGEKPKIGQKVTQTPSSAEGWTNLFGNVDRALAHSKTLPDLGLAENWSRVISLALPGGTGDLPPAPLRLHEWATKPEVFKRFFEEANGKNPELIKSAVAGLSSLEPVHAAAMKGQLPTRMVALHFMWGALSKMLGPFEQEAGWIKLTNSPEILRALDQSISGHFNMSREEWMKLTGDAIRLGPDLKAGNNSISNANAFHLTLTKWNGRWDQLAEIINNPKLSGPEMRREIYRSGLGAGSGFGYKVLSFNLLTLARRDMFIGDRWQFVNMWFPHLLATAGEGGVFSYNAKGIPEDTTRAYKSLNTLDKEASAEAVYSLIEAGLQKVADDARPWLEPILGRRPLASDIHWLSWNIIKNEPVGHSSLDSSTRALQEGLYEKTDFPQTFPGLEKSTEQYTGDGAYRVFGGNRDRLGYSERRSGDGDAGLRPADPRPDAGRGEAGPSGPSDGRDGPAEVSSARDAGSERDPVDEANQRKAEELDRRIEARRQAQERNTNPETRRRGNEQIAQRLVNELRNGGKLTHQEVSAALRIVETLMENGYLDNLAVSVSQVNPGEAVRGGYEPAKELVKIFVRNTNRPGVFEHTFTHEVAHHLERMVPAKDLEAARQQFLRERAKWLKDKLGYRELLGEGNWLNKSWSHQEIVQFAANNDIDMSEFSKHFIKDTQTGRWRIKRTDEVYRLTNFSEFFADTVADAAREADNARANPQDMPSFWGRIKDLFAQIKDALVGVFGRNKVEQIWRKFQRGEYTPDFKREKLHGYDRTGGQNPVEDNVTTADYRDRRVGPADADRQARVENIEKLEPNKPIPRTQSAREEGPEIPRPSRPGSFKAFDEMVTGREIAKPEGMPYPYHLKRFTTLAPVSRTALANLEGYHLVQQGSDLGPQGRNETREFRVVSKELMPASDSPVHEYRILFRFEPHGPGSSTGAVKVLFTDEGGMNNSTPEHVKIGLISELFERARQAGIKDVFVSRDYAGEIDPEELGLFGHVAKTEPDITFNAVGGAGYNGYKIDKNTAYSARDEEGQDEAFKPLDVDQKSEPGKVSIPASMGFRFGALAMGDQGRPGTIRYFHMDGVNGPQTMLSLHEAGSAKEKAEIAGKLPHADIRVSPDGQYAEVEWIQVPEGHEKRGIGGDFARRVMADLRNRNVDEISFRAINQGSMKILLRGLRDSLSGRPEDFRVTSLEDARELMDGDETPYAYDVVISRVGADSGEGYALDTALDRALTNGRGSEDIKRQLSLANNPGENYFPGQKGAVPSDKGNKPEWLSGGAPNVRQLPGQDGENYFGRAKMKPGYKIGSDGKVVRSSDDAPDWVDIGHDFREVDDSDGKSYKGDGNLWVMHWGGKFYFKDIHFSDDTHAAIWGDGDDVNTSMYPERGRVDYPVFNDAGQLIARGRISSTKPWDHPEGGKPDPQTIATIKARLAKQYNTRNGEGPRADASDFDVYFYGNNTDFKAANNLSRDDHGPGVYSARDEEPAGKPEQKFLETDRLFLEADAGADSLYSPTAKKNLPTGAKIQFESLDEESYDSGNYGDPTGYSMTAIGKDGEILAEAQLVADKDRVFTKRPKYLDGKIQRKAPKLEEGWAMTVEMLQGNNPRAMVAVAAEAVERAKMAGATALLLPFKGWDHREAVGELIAKLEGDESLQINDDIDAFNIVFKQNTPDYAEEENGEAYYGIRRDQVYSARDEEAPSTPTALPDVKVPKGGLIAAVAAMTPTAAEAASRAGAAVSAVTNMDLVSAAAAITLAGNDRLMSGLNPIVANMHLLARDTKSTTIRSVAEMFNRLGGNVAEGAQETYFEERDGNRRMFRNKLVEAFKPLAHLSEADLKALDQDLAMALAGEKTLTGPEAQVVANLQAFSDELFDYLSSAGVKVNYAKDYGMPHSFSSEKVLTNEQAFLADATRAYQVNNPMRIKRLTDYIQQIQNQAAARGGMTAEMVERQAELNKEINELQNARPADQAQALLEAIDTSNAGGDSTQGLLLEARGTGQNKADFTRERIFEPAARRVLRDYFNNDPRHAWNSYIARATTLAEFARRFGGDGSKWTAMVKQMRKENVPNKDITRIKNMVLDSLGVLNASPTEGHALAVSVLGLSNMAKLKSTAITNFLEAQAQGIPGHLGHTITAPVNMLGQFMAIVTELSPSQQAKLKNLIGRELSTETGSMELARAVGLIDAAGVHEMMENSAFNLERASDFAGATKTDKAARGISNATSALARAYGIEASENAKRAMATKYAANRLDAHVSEFLRDGLFARAWDKLHQNNPNPPANPFTLRNEAVMRLRRAGVSDAQMKAFAQWWEAARAGDFNAEIKGNDPMAKLARKVIRMESARASVNTNRSMKPGGKENPLVSQDTFAGKAMMSFLNYPATFAQQIAKPMVRDVKTAARGYETEGGQSTFYSGFERARMGARAFAIPAMAVSAAVFLALRAWASGHEDDVKEKPLWKHLLEGLTYTGVAGGKSEFASRVSRGQLPPVFDEGNRLVRDLNRNDDKKNGKERAVTEGAIRGVGVPAALGAASAILPVPLAAVIDQALASKTFRDMATDFIAGPAAPKNHGQPGGREGGSNQRREGGSRPGSR